VLLQKAERAKGVSAETCSRGDSEDTDGGDFASPDGARFS
jgi:hypothetical protein